MGFTFIYSKLNISSSLIHKSISELSKCNLHYFTKRYILVPLSSQKVYLSYENGIYIYILKVKYKFFSNQNKYILVIKMGFTFVYLNFDISSSLIHKSKPEVSGVIYMRLLKLHIHFSPNHKSI